VREAFREKLLSFVTFSLSPENLVPKKVNGQIVTCSELVTYIKTYMSMYQSDELPEPKTALQATAEAIHINAVNQSHFFYEKKMDAITSGSYTIPEELQIKHDSLKSESLSKYEEIKKIGIKN